MSREVRAAELDLPAVGLADDDGVIAGVVAIDVSAVAGEGAFEVEIFAAMIADWLGGNGVGIVSDRGAGESPCGEGGATIEHEVPMDAVGGGVAEDDKSCGFFGHIEA